MRTRTSNQEMGKSRAIANMVAQNKKSDNPAFQFIDNRPEAIAQRRLKQIINSKSPIQLKAIRGSGRLLGTVDYHGTNHPDGYGAYTMSAKNLRWKAGAYMNFPSTNEPNNDYVPGWPNIVYNQLTTYYPHYKRMHLLNGKLGGSGDDVDNLIPGSADMNSEHYNKVERHLHNHLQNDGVVLNYNVGVEETQTNATNVPSQDKNAFKSTIKKLYCEYELDDGNGWKAFTITETDAMRNYW
ncbi:DNA/RNA non-specific endonuclease [Roseivirga pacifica]|uniref:DNA/RNA non-specific endonuclease n=1 Tax=Roseivirga pacifica TaxID=1267423 RepID=UPI002094F203|nr:DNA/RNA non-specific endonuclease [Roseivirga pacifica]MCO6357526.1 hypothetical protein [Roseivirga pacifica]MCO6367709.1 hypothetical protein [Roseivirga pacifica]MCO6369759.1 hypothetical protein [Roseivirga pacifica]MCO6373613.1 hypothetical protein [Roseivirga pacifica]MCO6377082.1 hypothetical protein [Roseivirga pacifica]